MNNVHLILISPQRTMENTVTQTGTTLTGSIDHTIYHQLINTNPIAIYGCDANGLITFSNNAARTLWGREAVPGKDLWCGSWKIFNPDGSPLPLDECPMAVTLREGRAVYGREIIIERPDGTRSNVLSHPQPVFDAKGAVAGAVNSLVDITVQRRDQQTMSELQRSNSELMSFSYIASHDLQEPLRKIITFSDKLREQCKDLLPAESLGYIDKIISSSFRMRNLVEDVLNFSRVSSAERRYTSVNLENTAQDTLSDFEQLISDKKAKITIGKLPVIQACPLQMGQLFHNLLSNALKFSTTEPVISITCKELDADALKNYPALAKKETSYYEIAVRDNGIGFSEEDAERIFTMFQRLHGQSEYSGTGIGLSLCRRIADNHCGLITASSNGNGAEFRVLLPLDPTK